MAGGKKNAGKKDEALWLMSFCDLSFILMSFFVLLLSWSTMDKKKIENVAEALKEDEPKPDEEPVENLRTISRELEKIVEKLNLKTSVDVNYKSDGLYVEFKDALVFPTGSATSKPEFAKIADTVMKIVANSPAHYKIILEGHTDDVPVKGGKFESNWELSAARGFTLLRMLKQRGAAENRMSVMAFAHTQPKVPFDGLKGAKLQTARNTNRRVVIRIQ